MNDFWIVVLAAFVGSLITFIVWRLSNVLLSAFSDAKRYRDSRDKYSRPYSPYYSNTQYLTEATFYRKMNNIQNQLDTIEDAIVNNGGNDDDK